LQKGEGDKMNWIVILMPGGIIMFLFICHWIVNYPKQHWDSLTFRNGDGIKGHFVSVITWIWQLGAIATLVWIVALLSK